MAHGLEKVKVSQTVADMDVRPHRRAEYGVEAMFINRWSPRAMTGEQISDEQLYRLFTAARWAPSSYNNQPARFLFARRESPGWDKIYKLMNEHNRSWTKNAAVIMVVISKKTFDFNGSDAATHSYDTGAAWQNLALQGSLMGLVVHGMQGFNYKRTRKALNIPEDYQVEAMAAVGVPAPIETLPADLQVRELPSDRKRVEQIAFDVGSDADFDQFLESSKHMD